MSQSKVNKAIHKTMTDCHASKLVDCILSKILGNETNCVFVHVILCSKVKRKEQRSQ